MFCKHNKKLEKTLYGDIITWLGYRQIWKCTNCNKIFYK